MRKVFLENLPKWENGRYKGKIDWQKSIGLKVEFIYDNIQGEIKIIDYIKEKQRITLKYLDNEPVETLYSSFINCKIAYVLGIKDRDFRLNIGDNIKDDKRDFVIIDKFFKEKEVNHKKLNKIYTQSVKYYKFKCNRCPYEGELRETEILNGYGCACCSGKVAVLGVNTIWDTNREWIEKYGVSEEDAKRYSKGTHNKINVVCPHCKKSKEMRVVDIHRYKSISCKCGDGISYSEKFMMSILDQLNIEYITQLNKSTFSWCENYKYDFYIPKYNIIIETHGIQHYEYSGFRQSLNEVQENDKNKECLALKNNIDKYIIINCMESKKDYIKESVLNSDLRTFDLSSVDWNKCDEFATSNLIRMICDYWNTKKEEETTADLGVVFNIHKSNINKYLKKGSELGWCDYNPKDEMRKSALKNSANNKKQVFMYKDGEFIDSFTSCHEIEDVSIQRFGVKLNFGMIAKSCRNKIKYKGYNFYY